MKRSATTDATPLRLRKKPTDFDNGLNKLIARLKKFDPEIRDDYTKWINLQRNASIRILDPKDKWKDDDSSIQIKRNLSVEDLSDDYEYETDEIENIHINEKTLDVIKLPMAIPTKDKYPTDQYLFVRPDDYELFLCFGQSKECILTGNPGISKSWFQWKYILFCFRQDLYNQLWFDEYLKKSELIDEKKELTRRELFIPNFIVRTVAGENSLIFFLQGEHEVTKVFHQPKHLSVFTNAETTILWEPSRSKEPVCYDEITAHIIATVSPDQDRYKEFRKNGARMFYLPCPSKIQLRLIGQIYREVNPETKDYPTDQEICQRVTKYGPFIRIVLSRSPYDIDEFVQARVGEIERLQNKPDIFLNTVCARNHITVNDNNILYGLSDRLSRFVVDRDPKSTMFGFTIPRYAFSSTEVVDIFNSYTEKLDLSILRQYAIRINSFEGMNYDYYKVLGYLFRSSSNTGVKWKSYPMTENASEQDFVVRFTKVERETTLFENLESGILYYPESRNLPLVDFYYLDKDKTLVGIQATIAKSHAENVTVYNQFLSKLVLPEPVDGNSTKFKLYYLILPRQRTNYIKEQYPDSTFWKNVSKNKAEIAQLKQKISFYALIPPDNFGYDYSTV